LSAEALLPPPLQLRKEIQRLPEIVRDLHSEQEVRDIAETLNQRIKDWHRSGFSPPVLVGPVEVESVVEQWCANQPATIDEGATRADEEMTGQAPRARWWRRIVRPLPNLTDLIGYSASR
jgi:hypothetical protein